MYERHTVVNKMSECVSGLQCIKLYILGGMNHFRLLNFNIGSRVAQYNDQMVYKLSLSVLDGQLELEMNIDVFIQK